MRIKVELGSEKKVVLPVAYNHIIQGFIYGALSNELAEFLHEKGYVLNDRHFKLFTFSRVFGRYRVYKGSIVFDPPVYFYLSSPFVDILEELVNTIFTGSNPLQFGKNNLLCTAVSVLKEPFFERGSYIIKMLSPMTVYRTEDLRGKKRTYYYGPQEKEFSERIEENLKRKYMLITKSDNLPSRMGFVIEPFKVDIRHDFILTYFKDTIVKGWMGLYRITGNRELIRVAYDTGLGSKNSAGFGMWELTRGSE